MLSTFCFINDHGFYFLWKPFGIPSTFGKQKSFLDYMSDREISIDYKSNPPFFEYFKDLKSIKNIDEIINNQIKRFPKNKEFGLLNRLDNDTSGLLYFAPTPQDMDKYRHLQSQGKVNKFYIAQIHGNFNENNSEFQISYPIMHHKSKADRMIVVKTSKDILKGRGRQHYVSTMVKNLNYNKHTDISTLLISINKGIRHQIRLHLASIGSPVIGDTLYGQGKKSSSITNAVESKLQLFSIGFKFSE